MHTQNIESVLTEYLQTANTQYAVLLNGTWGTGKTYFWENSLKKIAEQQNYKTLYISLNGLSKIDTIQHKLFITLLHFVGKTENKRVKSGVTLFTNLLNKVLLKNGAEEALKEGVIDLFNFSNYIICFDDLERCQIPIKEVLGFINSYVEHKNLKTIILADENEIKNRKENKESNGYDDIKEKVIGRVINYEPNLYTVLPLLFEKYESTNKDFYKFLMKDGGHIIDILLDYKEVNLRIIAFYISILEKTFPLIRSVEKTYILEVMLFSALISIEFKRGRLNSSDARDAKGIDSIDKHYYASTLARASKQTESPSEETYDTTFYKRYLMESKIEYHFYQSIYFYILTGYFNSEELEKELKNRYPEVISDEIECFRKLINSDFRELTNSEFAVLTSKVFDYAKNGKYSIYDYKQVADFFLFFSSNQLIEIGRDEILLMIDTGLNIAKERKQINDRVLENLLHFKSDNLEVESVKIKISDIHQEIKKEEYINDGNAFLNAVKGEGLEDLKGIFLKYQLSEDLFSSIDPEHLFKILVSSENKRIDEFTDLLKGRYTSSNIGEYLFKDHQFLNILKEKIEKHITESSLKQPELFLLSTLSMTLNNICEHLLATQ